MRIVAVGGSPRKGNSEWMLNQLALYLREKGAQVDVLLLRKMDIKQCVGCLKCEDRKGLCRLDDGMNNLYPTLLQADTIVMASPVYFEMISGRLKTFIDRTCPVWTQLEGKTLAGLLCTEEGLGQSGRNLQQYASVCRMRWLGAVTTLAKNPGDTEKDAALTLKLKRLAGRIMDSNEK